MTTPQASVTQQRIAAFITELPPERVTVDTVVGVADVFGVPVETFLVGVPSDAQITAAATQMYAFEHPGESRLPDDWEGALFKRRARAVLEAVREASA